MLKNTQPQTGSFRIYNHFTIFYSGFTSGRVRDDTFEMISKTKLNCT